MTISANDQRERLLHIHAQQKIVALTPYSYYIMVFDPVKIQF